MLRSSTCRLSSRSSQCPRSLWAESPQRSAARRPQTAEQLVEVPTERGHVCAIIATNAVGWRGAAALAEQLVATPVPQGRRGGSGGLQDSRAGQGSSAAVVKQIVDIPVPHCRRGKGGGPQGSLPGQNSTAANVEQIVDLPARGGLQGIRQGQGSSSSRFLQDEDEGFQGGFRTFRGRKSLRCSTSPKTASSTPASAPEASAAITWQGRCERGSCTFRHGEQELHPHSLLRADSWTCLSQTTV